MPAPVAICSPAITAMMAAAAPWADVIGATTPTLPMAERAVHEQEPGRVADRRHDEQHHLLPPEAVGHALRQRERRRDHRADQQHPPQDGDGRDHPGRPADAQSRGRPHRGRDQAAYDCDHRAGAPSSTGLCSPRMGHVATAGDAAVVRRRAWCRATRVRFRRRSNTRAIRTHRLEVTAARAAAPWGGTGRVPEELDRRPRDPGQQQRGRTRRQRCIGRTVGCEPKDPRDPGARLVDALDGGGREGTAADRGVEQLAERGPQRHELRQPERDLGALLGFERALPFQPGAEIAGRAHPGVRERERCSRLDGYSVTYPLGPRKSSKCN